MICLLLLYFLCARSYSWCWLEWMILYQHTQTHIYRIQRYTRFGQFVLSSQRKSGIETATVNEKSILNCDLFLARLYAKCIFSLFFCHWSHSINAWSETSGRLIEQARAHDNFTIFVIRRACVFVAFFSVIVAIYTIYAQIPTLFFLSCFKQLNAITLEVCITFFVCALFCSYSGSFSLRRISSFLQCTHSALWMFFFLYISLHSCNALKQRLQSIAAV